MSTMQSPPPDAPVPPGPPERRCPRCGNSLAAEQEWCLACGAAAGTEVVEARGWRVPLYLGGGLAALAVLGVILAIAALASRNDQVAQTPTPTPSAAPPAATAAPTTTPDPLATVTPAPGATVDPNATATPDPNATPTPSATPGSGNTTSGSGSTFAGWPGGSGYTIILESNKTKSGAEKVAQSAQDAGETVGVLKSDDFSSLNGGYWVVFTEKYASKKAAETALSGVRSSHADAYVRQITPS
jgi:hypothetical protein